MKTINVSKFISFKDVKSQLESELFNSFVGWEVIDIGMTETAFKNEREKKIEGGLTLILRKNNEYRKVVLGYTELGEWVEYVGALNETR